MARAAGSNTKFASVNLNKSYGKPAASASATASGSSGGGGGNGSGRLARTSSASASHGGMLLLSRAGAVPAASKGSKVIVPLPVNLPSLRREHAGNDPSIALVGGSGSGGWTKAAPVQEEASVAASTSEPTTGRLCVFVRLAFLLGAAFVKRFVSSTEGGIFFLFLVLLIEI